MTQSTASHVLTITSTSIGVHLDHENNRAYIHHGIGVHHYDSEHLDLCDSCVPDSDAITGGDDGSVSPLKSADPDRPGEGVGAACDVGDCPFVAAGPNEDDARTLLGGHIRAEHPEGDEEDWLVDGDGNLVDDDGLPVTE